MLNNSPPQGCPTDTEASDRVMRSSGTKKLQSVRSLPKALGLDSFFSFALTVFSMTLIWTVHMSLIMPSLTFRGSSKIAYVTVSATVQSHKLHCVRCDNLKIVNMNTVVSWVSGVW